MADEKAREHNQPNDQDRGKAMGAGASAGYQGQDKQTNPDLNSQRSETAGQGGGIQGSGQRQNNPGGFAVNEDRLRDEAGGNEAPPGGKEPRGE